MNRHCLPTLAATISFGLLGVAALPARARGTVGAAQPKLAALSEAMSPHVLPISSLEQAYSQDAHDDAYVQSSHAIDRAAQSNSACKDLEHAGAAAATAYTNQNTPPDPTKVLNNSTCFASIFNINPPDLLGSLSGTLDSLMNQFSSRECQISSITWQNIAGALRSGNTTSLLEQSVRQEASNHGLSSQATNFGLNMATHTTNAKQILNQETNLGTGQFKSRVMQQAPSHPSSSGGGSESGSLLESIMGLFK